MFRGFGAGIFRCLCFFTFKLEQDLLVETKALLPAFELVTRLLRGFFVGAEIEDQE